MARAKSANGHERLEEALTRMVQNQAALLARAAETDRESVEIKRQMVETQRINNERFARIEATLLEHSRILAEHSRILANHTSILQHLSDAIAALPDAIRGKLGFRPPE